MSPRARKRGVAVLFLRGTFVDGLKWVCVQTGFVMLQWVCLACLTSDPSLPSLHPNSCASPLPIPHPPTHSPSTYPPTLSQQRSVSENSLVAMDFSGRTGRVIDNPVEAQSAALEEGQTWRVIHALVWIQNVSSYLYHTGTFVDKLSNISYLLSLFWL